jgi:hypothetical protein
MHKSIHLPVVLYGCETWSLTLREEHRLKVFENRELRRIFGPKKDEVTGEWRKLHNLELSYFVLFTRYCKSGQVKENETSGSCSSHVEMRYEYKTLVQKL